MLLDVSFEDVYSFAVNTCGPVTRISRERIGDVALVKAYRCLKGNPFWTDPSDPNSFHGRMRRWSRATNRAFDADDLSRLAASGRCTGFCLELTSALEHSLRDGS
jgi:hypothetical protein